MGQEWAATAPFLFFTDHNDELGRLVKEGRRHEFRDYAAFADPGRARKIPESRPSDVPRLQDRLVGASASRTPRRSALSEAARLRRTEPALSRAHDWTLRGPALDDDSLLLRRDGRDEDLALGGRPAQGLGDRLARRSALSPGRHWELVLTTEDTPFATYPSSHDRSRGRLFDSPAPALCCCGPTREGH